MQFSQVRFLGFVIKLRNSAHAGPFSVSVNVDLTKRDLRDLHEMMGAEKLWSSLVHGLELSAKHKLQAKHGRNDFKACLCISILSAYFISLYDNMLKDCVES